MTSENYRQLLNAERDNLEMTNEDFDNTLMHFAMLYHKEQLKLYDVSGNALLSKARQMRLEQQLKIDSYTEHYNRYQIGTLNGIDRIVKLIERHYR
jgi:hypothetical protein